MRWLKRGGEIATGRALREAFNYAVDYLLYPAMLLWLGFWKGLLVMLAVTACENLAMLVWYRRVGTDWLGYEYVQKAMLWATTKAGERRGALWLLRRSDVAMFVVLATIRDAFETTAYFAYQRSLSRRRGTAIFMGSWLLGNVYWALGIEFLINSWLRILLSKVGI